MRHATTPVWLHSRDLLPSSLRSVLRSCLKSSWIARVCPRYSRYCYSVATRPATNGRLAHGSTAVRIASPPRTNPTSTTLHPQPHLHNPTSIASFPIYCGATNANKGSCIGMAMRLCFDIGLHIDATPYVEQDAITAEELLVRQMTFWAAFVIN